MKVIIASALAIMMMFNFNISKRIDQWRNIFEEAISLANSDNPSETYIQGKTQEQICTLADNIMSWQLENGGWSKDMPQIFERQWNKKENKSKYYQMDGKTPLGTIDNDATVKQLYILAECYQVTKDDDVKQAINKGLNFLVEMQYDLGGFPQVYPVQDSTHSLYENMATFNDDATIRVLTLFQNISYHLAPFDDDVIDQDLRHQVYNAYAKGIQFILKSQIRVDGKLTGWCAQHDPYTYAPVAGRPFEPKSISGQESVTIAKFLQTVWPRTAEVQMAIDGFVEWLETVAVEDVKYYRYPVDGSHFVETPGKLMWYRFYEIGTNKALFGDSDGSIYYTIEKISLERRKNYGYAGDWGKTLVSR
ncbi:pectate lyase [Vallitaleaceae bacterium 9-2]